jgi:hypothetical protein
VDVPEVREEVRRPQHVARLRAYSVEQFLDGKGDRARELFDAFERLIAKCGPYEVAPAKTRVAFMGRVRFAGVNSISYRGMTIAFGWPLRHPRIRKIEAVKSGWS